MHRYQVGFIPTWGIYKYPQENKDWFSIWKSVIKVDILNKQNYSHFRDTEKACNKIDFADKKTLIKVGIDGMNWSVEWLLGSTQRHSCLVWGSWGRLHRAMAFNLGLGWSGIGRAGKDEGHLGKGVLVSDHVAGL